MNTILISICSNNYLAHVQTMFDSFKKHHPDVLLVAYFVDEFDPRIDYTKFSNFNLIHYSKTDLGYYNDMKQIYTAYEFANALKPFFIEYTFLKYGNNNIVICLDADTYITSSFTPLISHFSDFDIILTPHFINPYSSDNDQAIALWHGDYNLGFIAVKYTAESIKCIKWLQSRCIKYAKADKRNGYFGEQKWMNLAPIFFKRIHILTDYGFNVAWWNLSEREIVYKNNFYYVNNLDTKLVFFHFSGLNPTDVNSFGLNPKYLSYLNINSDLYNIYHFYSSKLLNNDYIFYKEFNNLLSVYGDDLRNVEWGIVKKLASFSLRKLILHRINSYLNNLKKTFFISYVKK